jgi:phosphoglycerate dehydrogenase-like enzyme
LATSIAILDDVHNAYAATEPIQRLSQRPDVQLKIFTQPWRTLDALREFEVLVANRERSAFPRPFFEALPALKLLVQTGGHAYHIDFDAARMAGVRVASAGGGSLGAAELTIGLMIALTRQLVPVDAGVRQGGWPAPLGLVLEGKTLGLIGVGRQGGHVARVAQALRMRVLAWTPRLTDARAAELDVQRRDLDDLLRESDIVSVHAPLSAESRGLLDARRLGLMKRSAFLVNTARGPIVDEVALVAALRAGALAGAGLDVFDQEPLPPAHPLTGLSNVVLTAHIGWPTDRAYATWAASAVELITTYLDGGEVPPFPGH